MVAASRILAALGVVVAAWGVFALWRLSPDDPRYTITDGHVRGGPQEGLRNFLRDQQRGTLIVLLGTLLQFASVLCSAFAIGK